MNRPVLVEIFHAALQAADPYEAVRSALSRSGSVLRVGGREYDLDRFVRVVVVGAGKATAAMARAAEELLCDRISEGLIIVTDGHTAKLERVVQQEAGHPLTDGRGVEGTKQIVRILTQADEKTLALCLFSGGASALLESPANGVSLEDQRAMTDVLLKAGADIGEVNTMRKHLSGVKGGRLAELAWPATVVSLILSDVIGDRIDVIASGPTAPDPTTFRDALAVVHTYGLEHKMPASVFSLLHLGKAGVLPDTPKDDAVFFQKTQNVVIGSLGRSLSAARDRVAERGFEAEILSAAIQGEARTIGQELARKAAAVRSSMKHGERPRCLLSGGETTVKVMGKGKGGRNQELALAFSLAIEGCRGISLLSAGTDGTDGPTDAAGAVVGGQTIPKARKTGLDPEAALLNNDSSSFFQELDSRTNENHLLITGPTGTNVGDVQIILITAGDSIPAVP
jgi:glycerate 2-kinase